MRRAKSPTELGFNRYDERRLKKALKDAGDKRTFQRVQAVLLVAQGWGLPEVALIVGVSLQAVYTWVIRYLAAHQVSALQDAARSGRPRTAPPITSARILREVRRSPLRLGYRTTVWTVPLLTRHLSRLYHCTLSPYTLRRRMKALGLRCKRPRYVYEEKEPHRAQKKGLLCAAYSACRRKRCSSLRTRRCCACSLSSGEPGDYEENPSALGSRGAMPSASYSGRSTPAPATVSCSKPPI